MMKTTFKRSLLAAAVVSGLCMTVPSYAASNTAGSVYGEAKANSQITYVNEKTGLKRTVTVPSDGRFNINNIPPGVYKVTDSEGNTRQVLVKVGIGTAVSFDGEIESLSVIGSRIMSIDTSSVESTSVFMQDDIELLPIPRDVVNVALLTAGTSQGGSNFGRNLPTFGGASIGENGFYVDGFDVTNLRNLLNFAKIPNDAISQTEVKSGGYGVEYGRSLGGITNIITKSGTNDWEFGGSAIWSPDSLRASGKNTYDLNYSSSEALVGYSREDEDDRLAYTLFASGPIIEDKLFFFLNAEGRQDDYNNYGTISSTSSERDNPNYIAKLDWYISEDHLFKLTYIDNKVERTFTKYDYPEDQFAVASHVGDKNEIDYKSGGDIVIANYTGYITDNFNVRVLYGQLKHEYETNPNLPGADCPYAWDTTGERGWAQREKIGCWNSLAATVGDEFPNKDERTSYKVDFDWTLGDHHIRFGYNAENYDSFDPGIQYSGNIYYRYIDGANYNEGYVNGVDVGVGTNTVRVRKYNTESAKFSLENTAWYIEDNWQVTDNFLAYIGVRGETFDNKDGSGKTFVESGNLIAPRFGFSWDINGDSTKKLYGTLGRYYIPIPTNTNIRVSRNEFYTQDFHYVDGYNSADGTPIGLGDKFGNSIVDNQVPDPRKIADHNLKPMHQDELIIGYQQQVSEDWLLSAKIMGRTIKDGMDDFCAHDGFTNWAADNGYEDFNPNTLQGCIIINPGRDITVNLDVHNNGELEAHTVSNSYFELPKYKRHYVGLLLEAEKSLSDNWYGNFSYTLSRTFGNAEGYVNSTLAQEDPGATQDFDHKLFMDGSYGNLPTDHRHVFKFYGAYEVTEDFTVATNMVVSDGIPLNCNGYIPTDEMSDHDRQSFERYSASSFYCGGELTQRGDAGRAPWTFKMDMSLIYQPSYVEGLTVQANIFNLFNSQKATTFDQTFDFERGNPNPSENYLNATGYQAPRSVQLIARYKF
ncbi:Oar protein [Shewanella sp. OPT22]|nr:Oar protein [Shewanella sp. OPT22]